MSERGVRRADFDAWPTHERPAGAIEHALVAAEDDEAKCLDLGPDRAGNLEVASVLREDGSEVVSTRCGCAASTSRGSATLERPMTEKRKSYGRSKAGVELAEGSP